MKRLDESKAVVKRQLAKTKLGTEVTLNVVDHILSFVDGTPTLTFEEGTTTRHLRLRHSPEEA